MSKIQDKLRYTHSPKGAIGGGRIGCRKWMDIAFQKQSFKKAEKGFTLMEIVVATTIFAFVAASLMALFNFTLKINRRTEAQRQAVQGMRNVVEYVVKTVRNGQIDYNVVGGSTIIPPVGPCPQPSESGPPDGIHDGNNTYLTRENRLSLYDEEDKRLCLYLGNSAGNYVNPGVFSGANAQTLVLEKEGGFKQALNPPNFKIENLMFLIRPLEDPYFAGAGGLIRVQPSVTIIIKAVADLPTKEKFSIFYQTTVSSDKYDIPNK